MGHKVELKAPGADPASSTILPANMMGIRHSTDSVRVRIVLTTMEDTSGDLTGAVPLGPADARIHDPTRPGSPKRPSKRWETSEQQREPQRMWTPTYINQWVRSRV